MRIMLRLFMYTILVLATSFTAQAKSVNCEYLTARYHSFGVGMSMEEFRCFKPKKKLTLTIDAIYEGTHKKIYYYRKLIGKVYVGFEEGKIYKIVLSSTSSQ